MKYTVVKELLTEHYFIGDWVGVLNVLLLLLVLDVWIYIFFIISSFLITTGTVLNLRYGVKIFTDRILRQLHSFLHNIFTGRWLSASLMYCNKMQNQVYWTKSIYDHWCSMEAVWYGMWRVPAQIPTLSLDLDSNLRGICLCLTDVGRAE